MPRGVVRSRSSYTKPSFGRPLKFQIPLDCATYEERTFGPTPPYLPVRRRRRRCGEYGGCTYRKREQFRTSNLNNSTRPTRRGSAGVEEMQEKNVLLGGCKDYGKIRF